MLVAEADGEIVGHAVATRGALAGRPALGLGPVSVSPARQRDGVGSALVHAILGAADAMGEPVVVLLGSPDYYRRFGFVPASTLGIVAPDSAWGDYFQARVLATYDESVRGTFAFAAPFSRR